MAARSSRSKIATVAPWAANMRAVAMPIPRGEAAPEMTATLPARSFDSDMLRSPDRVRFERECRVMKCCDESGLAEPALDSVGHRIRGDAVAVVQRRQRARIEERIGQRDLAERRRHACAKQRGRD